MRENKYIKANRWRVIMFFIFLSASNPCLVQGSLVSEAAEQAIKMINKLLGHEAAEEVSRKFGKEGVEIIMDRALREGGNEAVQRTVKIIGENGIQAIRVLKNSPVTVARALEELPSALVKPALWTLERDPELMISLASKYGGKALEIEITHPGVGGIVLKSLGDEAFEVGKKLSTDEMTRLARYSNDIAKLPTADRFKLLDALKRAPGHILGELEKHPKVLLTAGGVVTMLGVTHQITKAINEQQFDKDGNPQDPGLMRYLKWMFDPIRNILVWVIGLMGIIFIVRAAFPLWTAWKRSRSQVDG